MKIALVSEGTYPFVEGGVSVWCDQLIRGLPDYKWEMVALTVDGSERVRWDLPDNLEAIRSVPLWGPTPTAGRRRGSSDDFAAAYRAFLSALLKPPDPRSERAAEHRREFVSALRALQQYALSGGDLGDALTSNAALTLMMDAWSANRADDDLTLADALQAAWLLEHMLRPLWTDPVSADTDLVHASMGGLSMLVAMAAKWRHGTPVVLSEHGIYLRERYLSYINDSSRHAVKVLVLSFFRALAGAGYLMADIIAPHSSYNRRWELQHGADPQRMWTMYNGVSLEDFSIAPADPDVPTIVFMGRIDPLKDLHTLIRAFARVRTEVPQAQLRMFGGTPAGNEGYRDSCEQLIDELGLQGAAVLEGRVDTPVAAYHSGTLVALTSISEGFPYTVIEAMACGRAVVCTNVGGVSEAVGETGLVVRARDDRAIAEACVRLLRDDHLRRNMAAAARQRVIELFTLQHSLNAYRDVYLRALGLDPADPEGERVLTATLPRLLPGQGR
jgi:polysaccharide biosynthesis protein PelF